MRNRLSNSLSTQYASSFVVCSLFLRIMIDVRARFDPKGAVGRNLFQKTRGSTYCNLFIGGKCNAPKEDYTKPSCINPPDQEIQFISC